MKTTGKNSNRVLVAMSGGVDSSVAALLLQRSGCEVIGATMDTGYGDAPLRAAEACAVLGIPHHVIELKQRFDQEIVAPFCAAYAAGKTPNPCVLCNVCLKFSAFRPLMDALDCGFFATGHYARIDERAGRQLLFRGRDEKKDQSYFLYRLDQDTLFRCLFPLGNYTKEQVRMAAQKFALPAAESRESQDVCFIPDGDYRRLLQERNCGGSTPGEIVDAEGRVVGLHGGLANYTVGQRHGLALSLGYPAYVLALDVAENRLLVGEKEHLLTETALTEQNCFLPFDTLEEPLRVQVKIRYRSKGVNATILPEDKERLRILFDEPVSAVTPGQSAVFYDNEMVVGGGYLL